MTFDEILTQLPTCPGITALPITQPSSAFGYPSQGSPDFVGPPLKKREDALAQTPDIIVISASGAVGKTTLARELAFRKSAPLWDLAEDDAVGIHSVIGRLTTSFQANYSTAFKAGQAFLVIDALDEGRLKANEAGFAAFLKDLATQLPGKKGSCKAVLLGRTHVAESAWLTLVDAGAEAGIVTIEPFTDEQAARYVDLRVKRIGGEGATTASSHPDKYREARDAIFAELRAAFAGPGGGALDEQASAFLGYAPVLDAIATLLAKESNFVTLIQDLRSGTAGQNKSMELLTKIVERVLVREQDEKVNKNLKQTLSGVATSCKWNKWETLYTQNEQSNRLLARVLGAPAPVLSGFPDVLLAAYEERLASFVPEHPFLTNGKSPANVVFESYLYAKALVQNSGSFRQPVESRMASPSYKPSRLLAEFYQLLLGGRSVGIPPAHIGFLQEALQAGEGLGSHLRLSIDGLDPEDDDSVAKSVAACEFEYIGAERRVVWSWKLETDVEPTSEFSFRRYLRDAAVTVPCTIALGEPGKEFEIGPAVQLSCSKLRLLANNLIVGGTTRPHSAEEDSAVILEAGILESAVSTRPRVHQVALRVSWPDADRFPWTDFRVNKGVEGGGGLHEAYRRFRRIVMTLRSHSKGNLARFQDKIEHHRVLHGPMGQALLDKLKADGILRLDGNMYYWVPELAAKLVGTSWHDLRKGLISDQLKGYLTQFLSTIKAVTP